MIALQAVVSALALVAYVQAAPLQKRIAQTIAEATTKWEQACVRPINLLLFRELTSLIFYALFLNSELLAALSNAIRFPSTQWRRSCSLLDPAISRTQLTP
jgi:chemotaxis regulatin CheY-phosphate phosphatase CheZ